MKRWLFFAAKIALAGGLIAYLITRLGQQEFDLENLLARVKDHWYWIALAQLPFGIVLILAAWRWQVLLRAQGIRYKLREILALTLIGFFFNQVLLGSTGGDLVKAYYVAADQPGRRAAAVLTIFLDRLVGLVVLLLIATVAVLLNLELVGSEGWMTLLALVLGGMLVGAVLLGVPFFSETVRRQRWVETCFRWLPFQSLLRSLSAALYAYKAHHREVLLAAAIALGLHLCVVATNVCLFLSLGEELPLVTFLLLVPLGQMALAIPVTPAGWGTGEAAYDQLFSLVTKPGFGLSLCLLQRAGYYLFALFGCFAYLRRRGEIRRAMREAGEERPESGAEAVGEGAPEVVGEERGKTCA